jgi:hypothetical protein
MTLSSVVLFGALVLSASLNLFLIWFVYKSARQIRFYDDEIRSILTAIQNFNNHVRTVHEMEMFYGDETLRHLMRHSQDIVEVFNNYDLFSDTDEEESYDSPA